MTTFDGSTYDATKDRERLKTLMGRVAAKMSAGGWWTITELARVCGGTEPSVSARIRDLRKPRWGGHKVERRRVGKGLWWYRMVKP